MQIEKLKLDGQPKPVDEITLGELITLVRHSLAHAQFKDGGRGKRPEGMSVTYSTYGPNAMESVILQVNFVNRYREQVEFEAAIPVADLRKFARMTAEEFLIRLKQASTME